MLRKFIKVGIRSNEHYLNNKVTPYIKIMSVKHRDSIPLTDVVYIPFLSFQVSNFPFF